MRVNGGDTIDEEELFQAQEETKMLDMEIREIKQNMETLEEKLDFITIK